LLPGEDLGCNHYLWSVFAWVRMADFDLHLDFCISCIGSGSRPFTLNAEPEHRVRFSHPLNLEPEPVSHLVASGLSPKFRCSGCILDPVLFFSAKKLSLIRVFTVNLH
jgi:hypothetical protein